MIRDSLRRLVALFVGEANISMARGSPINGRPYRGQ